MIQLDNEIWFPNPLFEATDEGPFARGGDLSVERIDFAYTLGAFPLFLYNDDEGIMWWCPRKRFIIIPEEIHISHSMRQLIKSGKYRLSINEDFDGVIEGCSKANGRDEEKYCWLKGEIVDAYKKYHREGNGLSVEVWDGDKLVGGLYGGMVGNCFAGESMFSLVPSASKLALIYIAQILQGTGKIIDCHFETAHLKSMGGRYVTLRDFLRILKHEFVGISSQQRILERQSLMTDDKLLNNLQGCPYLCYKMQDDCEPPSVMVIVARKINNGNLVISYFRINMWLEGLIYNECLINVDEETLQKVFNHFVDCGFPEPVEIDYSEAHALIYKAYEWAKLYNKENADHYFSICSKTLEPDSDKYATAKNAITFGKDGKFAVVLSKEDTKSIKLWEKKLGKGNFVVIDM